MNSLTSGFNFPDVIRAVFIICMLSTLINLFCDTRVLGECPVNIDYTCKPLDLSWKVGSRFLFTYTISIDPNRVTEFDKQRTYRLESEYFSKNKDYGTFRTLSSSIKNSDTFTYDEFPIKGQLKIKSYEGNGSLFFVINVEGNAVKGDSSISMPDGLQQYSQLVMGLVQPEDYSFNIEALRIIIIILIIIVPISIFILFWRWRVRINKRKSNRV